MLFKFNANKGEQMNELEKKKKRKKKKGLEEFEIDEESEYPIHEKYVKMEHRKQA